MVHRLIRILVVALAIFGPSGFILAQPISPTPHVAPDILATKVTSSEPNVPAIDPAKLALARKIFSIISTDKKADAAIDELMRGAAPHELNFFKQSAHDDAEVEALFRDEEVQTISETRNIYREMIPAQREAMIRASARAYPLEELADALGAAQTTAGFENLWPDARIRQDPDLQAWLSELRRKMDTAQQQRSATLLTRIKAYRQAHPALAKDGTPAG